MHFRSSFGCTCGWGWGDGETGSLAPLPPPQSLPPLNTLLQSPDPPEIQPADRGAERLWAAGCSTWACLPLPALKKALDPFTPRMSGQNSIQLAEMLWFHGP